MSTPEECLQQSLADFYATLDSLRFTGLSQVAETQQLRILIAKYPDLARRFLTDHTPPGGGTAAS